MTAPPRLTALRARLVELGVDAMLVAGAANMRYLTGFPRVFDDGIDAAVLVSADRSAFHTDSRYIEAAETAATGTVWEIAGQRESVLEDALGQAAEWGAGTLAIEDSTTVARYRRLKKLFKGRLLVTEHVVEALRAVKDEAEVAAIERAAALTDLALEHVTGTLTPGMREIDISLALEVFMRSHGSEGLAFAPIVAGGPNSSRPHAGVTERAVRAGELLTMDIGARVDGYCADLTRTVVVGQADEEQRRVYEAVLAANEAALAAVRPGIGCADLDAVARGVLVERGLGERFGHGLGHGVGLVVHEMPSVGGRSRDVLVAGHVITIEPGAYVPGFGGVRIEDLVVVVEGGARKLSHSPKHLMEIG